MDKTTETFVTYRLEPEEFLSLLGIPAGTIHAAHCESNREGVQAIVVVIEEP